jgi:hypothetical protein
VALAVGDGVLEADAAEAGAAEAGALEAGALEAGAVEAGAVEAAARVPDEELVQPASRASPASGRVSRSAREQIIWSPT